MTKTPVPAVPSLHSFSSPALTKREEVAAYLIQFLFANPGSTSSVNEGEMMSFRKLVALHGNKDTNFLAEQIGNMLTTSLAHYFPKDRMTAVCGIEPEEGYDENGVLQGTYGITIAIRTADGTAVIPRSKISASKDGRSFKMIA